MDLLKSDFSQINSAIRNKKISCQEVAEFFLNRAQKLDKQLNSIITYNEKLIDQAKKLDQEISSGKEPGILVGLPFGIKDMLCTKGIKTTAGSKMLGNFIPPYDSTVVARLKKSGALVLGKLNQDEFAMGSSNETSAFGIVKNPWNTGYVPGGSSGGSAAAQAARLVAGSIGTDTGGSIRQPSNFCGVVGIKPTYGRVSRYGVIAYASSLDQAGPMVSSVTDAALCLESICGHDELDSTTSQKPVPQFSKNLKENFKGLKIGIIKEYTSGAVDKDVEKVFQSAITTAQKNGAVIKELSVPLTKFAVPIYYLVAASEASSNLARYDGVKYGHRSHFENLADLDLENFYGSTRAEGFGKEVKRRIMIGTYCLSSGYFDAYYLKACRVRRLLRDQMVDALKECDVILSPVSTTPAFKIGDKIANPLAMFLNDIFTTSTNLAGLPGMSLPYGFSESGLPIGIQLTGGHFQEEKLLQIAYSFEKTFNNQRTPNVF